MMVRGGRNDALVHPEWRPSRGSGEVLFVTNPGAYAPWLLECRHFRGSEPASAPRSVRRSSRSFGVGARRIRGRRRRSVDADPFGAGDFSDMAVAGGVQRDASVSLVEVVEGQRVAV